MFARIAINNIGEKFEYSNFSPMFVTESKALLKNCAVLRRAEE
jgi:hypothetical protein